MPSTVIPVATLLSRVRYSCSVNALQIQTYGTNLTRLVPVGAWGPKKLVSANRDGHKECDADTCLSASLFFCSCSFERTSFLNLQIFFVRKLALYNKCENYNEITWESVKRIANTTTGFEYLHYCMITEIDSRIFRMFFYGTLQTYLTK